MVLQRIDRNRKQLPTYTEIIIIIIIIIITIIIIIIIIIIFQRIWNS